MCFRCGKHVRAENAMYWSWNQIIYIGKKTSDTCKDKRDEFKGRESDDEDDEGTNISR